MYAAELSHRAIEIVADNSDVIEKKIAKSGVRNAIYELIDESGNVKYVGKTRQKLKARQK